MSTMLTRLGLKYLAKAGTIPRAKQLQNFLDKGYVAGFLRRMSIDCVLDVGANKGQYATSLRQIGYDGEIHSFEPIPEDFAILQERAASDSRWHTHNYALGRVEEAREFNLIGGGDDTFFSSFLEPDDAIVPQQIRKIPVQVRTLDSFATEIDALRANDRRLFLKMDTQGYDIEVCEGAKENMSRFLGLQSEISVKRLYSDQPDYLSALKYFNDLGFSLMNLAVVNRTPESAILEYDCIMARVG